MLPLVKRKAHFCCLKKLRRPERIDIEGGLLVIVYAVEYYTAKGEKRRQGCCLLNSEYDTHFAADSQSNHYSLGKFRLPNIEIERADETGWEGRIAYSFSF